MPIREADIQAIEEAANSMAGEGIRVLALAYAEVPPDFEELTDEVLREQLVWVGMAGMTDQFGRRQ
jgi:magnesium-transporting ATPase (P-type)